MSFLRRYDAPPAWALLGAAALLATILHFLPDAGAPPMHISQAVSTDDERAVLDVVGRLHRALAENDVEGTLRLIEADATFLLPGDPYRTDGEAADRATFETLLRNGPTPTDRFRICDPWIRVEGDAALVTFHARGSAAHGSNERDLGWKVTDMLRRTEAGWRFVHVHVSPAL